MFLNVKKYNFFTLKICSLGITWVKSITFLKNSAKETEEIAGGK